MDGHASHAESHHGSRRFAAILIAIAIALALIAPILPGGPHRPKPLTHPTPTATTEPPEPEPPPAPNADPVPGLWPAAFFIGAGAANQPTGSE